jgi:RNA polymerase sigma factor (sigma-70 family)
MLAALRAYPGLRDAQAVRGWLCSIAVHKAIDAHRAAAQRPTPFDLDLADNEAVTGGETDPLGDAQLWAQVRKLPDKQRTAVTLRYMADLTNDEIALVMKTSTDAARRNVFEGLQKLRSHATEFSTVFVP